MPETNKFHLSTKAAASYERQSVPAIFTPMAEATLSAISLPRRSHVLDVACGTGAVGRAVASRLVEPSKIVGADLNPAMVKIAKQSVSNDIHDFEFVTASSETLPFEDATFEFVFCQHGLQFFPDKPGSLAEMRRVIQVNGKLIVTCWAAIPPFFKVVSEALARHLGKDEAKIAVAPFVWNDGAHISSLISTAGFECPETSQLDVDRKLPATPDAMRRGLLTTPNEAALLAVGEDTIDIIVSEILEGVSQYQDGQMLIMPQKAHLFQAVAV
jgi:ubiquinone/menaquinone biosynthesis C-methylase UbiE